MAPTDRYRKIGDIPRPIAMFPLRGAILLPRATLPLNVFEPRYLQLVNDAIAGSRVIGIVQPERSDSEAESPPGRDFGLRPVGCAGRITAFQELDDGRFVITLTGICRFRVEGEIDLGQLYRTFDVDFGRFSRDLVAGQGEEQIDRVELLETLKIYLEARKLKANWAAISRESGEHLVNMLSIASPYGPEEKQALLEAADLKARAEVLVALAKMELASRDGGGGTTLQ